MGKVGVGLGFGFDVGSRACFGYDFILFAQGAGFGFSLGGSGVIIGFFLVRFLIWVLVSDYGLWCWVSVLILVVDLLSQFFNLGFGFQFWWWGYGMWFP